MMTSADQLERDAQAFAAVAQPRPSVADSTTDYLWEARDLAAQAHVFRETVEDGAGDRNVTLAYERLWHSYHSLRNELDRSDNHQAQVALKPVTKAFLQVEGDMRGYADTALYARGGYKRDPYYND
jgi:hypothetical protein